MEKNLYEELEDEYFSHRKGIEIEDLVEKIRILSEIIPQSLLDADVVSAAFDSDILTAAKAAYEFAKEEEWKL